MKADTNNRAEICDYKMILGGYKDVKGRWIL